MQALAFPFNLFPDLVILLNYFLTPWLQDAGPLYKNEQRPNSTELLTSADLGAQDKLLTVLSCHRRQILQHSATLTV